MNQSVIGERWEIGDAELEVSSPRVPCFKLAARIGDPNFVKTFGRARRPGPYLRITHPGTIAAGDHIRIVARPAHGIRVVDFFTIYLYERPRLRELLAAPEIPGDWTNWIHEQLAS
ncbi:MAG: hypothetical protein JWM87_237 [Candidatus Eremiobacteraeota bacterium]|nr:hypothetical protein [Candidatus Eremiobacteraeota bacterium]